MSIQQEEMRSDVLSRSSPAVFYGAGVGLAVISYLARSGVFRFAYHPAFKGSVTVIDALGYPKQQEIFWFLLGILLPLSMGLLYGTVERRWSISTTRGWWAALAVFLIQSPTLMMKAWPGISVAIPHILLLAFIPVFTEKRLRELPGDAEMPVSKYVPSAWFMPALLILFAGAVSHAFITMHTVSLRRMAQGTLAWSASISLAYYVLFRLLEIRFPSDRDRWDRATWGLMPVVFLPLYQLAWGEPQVYSAMLGLAALAGGLIFFRPPSWNGAKAALVFLPLGIGMALQLSPTYRYFYVDVIHEGQQLAFAQCVLRGMLPGMEKAVKYGPLYELSEGWWMKLFGVQVSVLRVYFMWAQVLGFWFGCLLIAEFVRRRWVIVCGWPVFLVMSIGALFLPSRSNGLRVGWPMLAIFFWSRRVRGGGVGWLLGAGATAAIGALYSVEFGLAGLVAMLVGVIAFGFAGRRPGGLRIIVREAAGLALGAAVVVVPFLSLYVARGGVLRLLSGMYEYANGFRLGYGAFPMPLFPWLDSNALSYLGANYFLTHFKFYIIPLVCLAAGAWLLGTLLSGKWASEHAVIAALWAYALACYRSALGRSDWSHIIPVLAPTAILIFILIDRLSGIIKSETTQKRSPSGWSLAARTAGFLLLITVPLFQKDQIADVLRRFMEQHTLKYPAEMEARLRKKHMRPLNLERAKGIWETEYWAKIYESTNKLILAKTCRDEPLHLVPLQGMYFFFADRIPLTRYCLTIDAVTPETRRQIVDQLRVARPRFIIGDLDAGMDFRYRQEHPDEVAYIEDNYEIVEKRRDVNIYARREKTNNDHK